MADYNNNNNNINNNNNNILDDIVVEEANAIQGRITCGLWAGYGGNQKKHTIQEAQQAAWNAMSDRCEADQSYITFNLWEGECMYVYKSDGKVAREKEPVFIVEGIAGPFNMEMSFKEAYSIFLEYAQKIGKKMGQYCVYLEMVDTDGSRIARRVFPSGK